MKVLGEGDAHRNPTNGDQVLISADEYLQQVRRCAHRFRRNGLISLFLQLEKA